MILRPCQQEAVDAVYEHLRTKDTTPCVVLPTGTGKSLCLAKIASDAVTLWGGRVLLLAHVKELLEQNADKVRRLCPELKVGRLFRRIELARHAGARHRGGHPKRVQQGLRPRTLRPRHRGRVPPHRARRRGDVPHLPQGHEGHQP